MLNLLSAILCSALISLVMRWGGKRGAAQTGMLLVNYVVCAALALGVAIP